MTTNKCRICGYETTGALAVDGTNDAPLPGDISVCLNCGAISKFGPLLALEPLTKEELRSTVAALEYFLKERIKEDK